MRLRKDLASAKDLIIIFCQVPKVHEVHVSVLRKTSYYNSNRGQENGLDIFSGIRQFLVFYGFDS